MANVIATAEQADAGDRAQQDAGGAALRRVQGALPATTPSLLRQLLRLLPARGVRPEHRHVHREGRVDQRRDRPDAPLGDQGAARAARRDHRRQRLVHLRPRLAGSVLRHARLPRARRRASTATSCCASSSTSSTSATTSTSTAARSACAATWSRSSRPTKRARALRIEFFGDEIERIAEIDPLRGTRAAPLDKVAIYPASHYVTKPDQLKRAIDGDPRRAARAPAGAARREQAARGAAARAAHHVRPRDARGDGLLPRHRELLAPSRPAASRASRRRR